jgi:hydrogenase assembly chaperone HypC/HupF
MGVPLQVTEIEDSFAWCEADGQRELLDMVLVGYQPVGTWVLGFQGAARQVLSVHEAALARAARQALGAALEGQANIDRFFADLVNREPELPAHLRKVPA